MPFQAPTGRVPEVTSSQYYRSLKPNSFPQPQFNTTLQCYAPSNQYNSQTKGYTLAQIVARRKAYVLKNPPPTNRLTFTYTRAKSSVNPIITPTPDAPAPTKDTIFRSQYYNVAPKKVTEIISEVTASGGSVRGMGINGQTLCKTVTQTPGYASGIRCSTTLLTFDPNIKYLPLNQLKRAYTNIPLFTQNKYKGDVNSQTGCDDDSSSPECNKQLNYSDPDTEIKPLSDLYEPVDIEILRPQSQSEHPTTLRSEQLKYRATQQNVVSPPQIDMSLSQKLAQLVSQIDGKIDTLDTTVATNLATVEKSLSSIEASVDDPSKIVGSINSLGSAINAAGSSLSKAVTDSGTNLVEQLISAEKSIIDTLEKAFDDADFDSDLFDDTFLFEPSGDFTDPSFMFIIREISSSDDEDDDDDDDDETIDPQLAKAFVPPLNLTPNDVPHAGFLPPATSSSADIPPSGFNPPLIAQSDMPSSQFTPPQPAPGFNPPQVSSSNMPPSGFNPPQVSSSTMPQAGFSPPQVSSSDMPPSGFSAPQVSSSNMPKAAFVPDLNSTQ